MTNPILRTLLPPSLSESLHSLNKSAVIKETPSGLKQTNGFLWVQFCPPPHSQVLVFGKTIAKCSHVTMGYREWLCCQVPEIWSHGRGGGPTVRTPNSRLLKVPFFRSTVTSSEDCLLSSCSYRPTTVFLSKAPVIASPSRGFSDAWTD